MNREYRLNMNLDFRIKSRELHHMILFVVTIIVIWYFDFMKCLTIIVQPFKLLLCIDFNFVKFQQLQNCLKTVNVTEMYHQICRKVFVSFEGLGF